MKTLPKAGRPVLQTPVASDAPQPSMSGVPFTHGTQPPSFAELKLLSDADLMAGLRAGCNDALAILFDRYNRLVLSIALKIVRDPGEAEDVMQTVFLEIFRSVAQFDPAKGTTKVWILQYAYHRAINRRQHLNARSFYDQTDLEVVEHRLPETPSTLGNLTQNELKRLLRQGLATLNGAQRQVIELASSNGLSMKEIANKRGDSLVNVRHHYYRGLQKLRSFIGRTPELKKTAGSNE
jgi:RNA polymerase sigma-70 factor (ECF subfamily)